ncbi:MAG: hypothetical protein WC998_02855 [Candidatus Paceibacterota bacterium]|jgi:hypothetical protein
MAENVTQIEGATEVEIYLRNYPYAAAITDMAALCEIYLTDLDRRAYKNAVGSLRKYMEDSTGSTNIPENRLLYSDENGRVTYDENFTINDGVITLLNGIGLGNGWAWVTTGTSCYLYKDGEFTGFGIET